MPRLDPDELRAYLDRDWGAPERLAREARANAPVEEKVRIAVALYEGLCKDRPAEQREAERRADFEAHVRLAELLRRAGHVGAR